MATSGAGSRPKNIPMQHLQARVARRRLSQARHRATMARLFNSLRKKVYSHSDLTASKWQVLNKAKTYIQELEQTLDKLLKLKESFNLEDGNANSLKEVKEAYARNYSESDSVALSRFLQKSISPWCPTEAADNEAMEGEKEEVAGEAQEEEEEEKEEENLNSEGTSPPDLLEFERYLNFYKQTMDLLTGNAIISPQEVTLPIVSAAISHLWQTLPEEKKASLLQPSILPDLKEEACLQSSGKDCGGDSPGASCSLGSTPEEILFEDAFDVAGFLDNDEVPSASSLSSLQVGSSAEHPEEKFQLYTQIINFFKSLCCVNTQLNQESEPHVNDELTLLKCMETFDDDLFQFLKLHVGVAKSFGISERFPNMQRTKMNSESNARRIPGASGSTHPRCPARLHHSLSSEHTT